MAALADEFEAEEGRVGFLYGFVWERSVESIGRGRCGSPQMMESRNAIGERSVCQRSKAELSFVAGGGSY